MNRLIITILLLTLSSCNEENLLRHPNFWKYADGSHFGDVLIFDEDYTLKNDTVYYLNQPEFIIEQHNNNMIFGPEEIWIKPLHSNQIGRYIAK